jgi:hypothetical protein
MLRFLCKVNYNFSKVTRNSKEYRTAVCFHRAFDMTRSAIEGESSDRYSIPVMDPTGFLLLYTSI